MTEASWQPDPSGRHDHRYWDGGRWTEHVADAGVVASDPLPQEPPAQQAAAEPMPQQQPAQPQQYAGGHHQAAQPEQQPAPQQAQYPAGGAPMVPAGIHGELIDGRYSEAGGDQPGPSRQNSKMLRVRVAEPFMAKQGAMVAYQGAVEFSYQGAGAAKFLKKAISGDGLSLMRVEGRGDVFLADGADEVHILQLTQSGISINGDNVLAFSASLDYDIERVKGGSMVAGGLFNTTLRGSGWVAVTTQGEPVVLNPAEAPTFADAQALVAWSADLQTSVKSSMSAGALIGRGSGEAFQIAFNGPGFVIVQPSENGAVPPHTH